MTTRTVPCAVCSAPIEPYGDVPGLICRGCDDRAVGASGEKPVVYPDCDAGENPVFVDGIECHRRYRFGGWVTFRVDILRTYRGWQPPEGSGVPAAPEHQLPRRGPI